MTRSVPPASPPSGEATRPDHPDPWLRGRTYAVPFEAVWTEAVRLAAGGLPRCRLLEADDRQGVLRAEADALLFGPPDDIVIEVHLDRDAQTRVDARGVQREGGRDFGRNRRRLRRFFRELDAALARSSPRPRWPRPVRTGKGERLSG